MKGYAVHLTGCSAHLYFDGGRPICRVSVQVLPGWPAQIEGFGRKWVTAPAPGRILLDAATGQERARVDLAIRVGESLIRVERAGEHYAFFRNGRTIAEIRPAPDDTDVVEFQGLSWQKTDEIWAAPDLDCDLLLCVLSYPLLRLS